MHTFSYFLLTLAQIAFKLILIFGLSCACKCEASSNLRTENTLHPLDGFTAYTLKKGEFIYYQSPFTLPLPSWAFIGLTDNLTIELDFLPLIGGLLEPPNLPVPSANLRYRIFGNSDSLWASSVEGMFQYLDKPRSQLSTKSFSISRRYGSGYVRFINSFSLSKSTIAHLSLGISRFSTVSFNDSSSPNRVIKKNDLIDPCVSATYEYKALPWMTVATTFSYGSTFVYIDNFPRKFEFNYGFNWAPFLKSPYLLLSRMRIETSSISVYFPDVNQYLSIPLPIYPYFYWHFYI